MQNATRTSSSQGILETTTNSEWKEAQNTDMYQRGPPGAFIPCFFDIVLHGVTSARTSRATHQRDRRSV